MPSYDAIVIGAGQGGSPLAHKLADQGWKVAFIEELNLGGSCINYGCSPTKAMLASARVAHQARRGKEFGVHGGKVTVDLSEVVARKNQIVLSMREGQERQVANRPNITLHRGHGRFIGPQAVSVNGEELTSERIFINTGTRPRIPSIPGIDRVPYYTNRDIMDLETLPSHLVVLGANYIGLEFAQMFARFGSRVTVLELGPQITPREDDDVAESLWEALADEGITVQVGARVTRVGKGLRGLDYQITHADGSTQLMLSSHLLVATGQVPNTDDLGLEAAGVEVDQGGYVKHNNKLETNVPGIWVIGDVKGGPAFTHVSYDDHLVIYDNLIGGKNRTVDGRIIPYALYTDPELGRVGMTEKEARAAGYKLKVGSIPMAWVARAIERSETSGMMKVVINAENDRILGAAILGPEGGELVQTLMTLMRTDQPWTVFEKAMLIHPTMTEGFFTLMDSVKPVD